MQSSLQSREEFYLLKLGGEIGMECSHKLKKQILASLKAGNPLLIDLADVKYIDSSGIVSLLEGFQEARSARLGYGLLNVGPAIMPVLTLTRLDRIFPMYNSVEQFRQQIDS